MDKNAIMDFVMETINNITDIDFSEMYPDCSVVDDLSMDSLEIMSMIGKLEQHYSVKFVTRELRTIVTISDIADYVIKKSN